MRIVQALLLFTALSIPVLAQDQAENPMPAGEFSVLTGGGVFAGGDFVNRAPDKATFSITVTYAHNTFNNPNTPFVLEVSEVGNDSDPFALTPRMSYIGAGLRFGGARAKKKFHPYTTISIGNARFPVNAAYPIGNPHPTTAEIANKISIAIAFGLNVGGPRWGIKAEYRGNKTKDLPPWIEQIGAGIYYRFGQ